jgi:hypothetical protein
MAPILPPAAAAAAAPPKSIVVFKTSRELFSADKFLVVVTNDFLLLM